MIEITFDVNFDGLDEINKNLAKQTVSQFLEQAREAGVFEIALDLREDGEVSQDFVAALKQEFEEEGWTAEFSEADGLLKAREGEASK